MGFEPLNRDSFDCWYKLSESKEDNEAQIMVYVYKLFNIW